MASINAEPAGELSQIAARNTIQSPLLRLPGELRNKILEYAVGGYTIVVRQTGVGSELGVYLTTASQRKPRETSGLAALSIFDESKKIMTDCDESVSEIVNVTRVCRHLYYETALLPFKTNVFYLISDHALTYLTEKLTIRQSDAISTISVGSNYLTSELFSRVFGSRPRIRKSLKGVKMVYIMPDALVASGVSTLHGTLVAVARTLGLGDGDGEGVWISWFDVLDEAAVLKDAPSTFIKSNAGGEANPSS